MIVKDYYKTLGVAPTATLQDIKKAFRKLAHHFHPDKNQENAQSAARFREIQEAYEVLSDPAQREEYNYKRWYRRTLGKEFEQAVLTPASILAGCRRLEEYVRTTNIFQVDYDGLSYHIRQLLNDTNIDILRQSEDKNINTSVIKSIIRSATPLPPGYIDPIIRLLLEIADGKQADAIRLFETEQKRKYQWGRYKVVAVLAATLLLCWLIYAVSR